ncbi:MAG: DMT family transporter [Clostridia bacterium]|nr:DMT family transporter [Clostridia bacterium]
MKINYADKKISSLLCLVAMFFWGSLFPMIKMGYNAFEIDVNSPASILLFAGIRFLICGIVLLILTFVRGKRIYVPEKSVFFPILLVALFAYVLHYTCTYIGLSHLESSKTALIKQIGTLFIICFAFLFRKEDKFTISKLAGGILGFGSIIAVNLNGLRLQFSAYDFLVIMAAVCTVLSTILSKNAYDKYDPLDVTAWAQLFGGVILLLIGLSMGGSIGKVDLRAAAILAYICFASCTGYALWNILLKYNNMSRLNTIKYTETLFSAVCSWILLGENIFKPEYLISFLLVCLGLLIGNNVIRLKRNKPGF